MCTHASPISGVSPVLISSRCICLRRQSDSLVLYKLFPPPMRPTHALRPAQGTYSVTFVTRRHGVGSPIVPALVIRHFVGHLFHQRLFLITLIGLECPPTHFSSPVEGPTAGFGPADSRVEYVNISIYLFSFICFHYLNVVYYFVETTFFLIVCKWISESNRVIAEDAYYVGYEPPGKTDCRYIHWRTEKFICRMTSFKRAEPYIDYLCL